MPDPSSSPAAPPSARAAAAVLTQLAALYTTHPLVVDPAQPFQVLVATVLSARTKDPTTNAALRRLWAAAAGLTEEQVAAIYPHMELAGRRIEVAPRMLLELPEARIAALLNPVGFYKTKARHLRELAALLLSDFDGAVPRTRDELLLLPGVGRKVANLVLNICFNAPAICVDVHVHRIANRLGWVATANPEQTERALELLVPQRLWAVLNRVLVNHGQQVCTPQSPHCSRCPIARHCARSGVDRSR